MPKGKSTSTASPPARRGPLEDQLLGHVSRKLTRSPRPRAAKPALATGPLDTNLEPLWLENVRTMLSHFNVLLRAFDPVAANKFRWRKKSRVDHRSMAQHSETLIKNFERTGKIGSE
jgi:hypothetical protein